MGTQVVADDGGVPPAALSSGSYPDGLTSQDMPDTHHPMAETVPGASWCLNSSSCT